MCEDTWRVIPQQVNPLNPIIPPPTNPFNPRLHNASSDVLIGVTGCVEGVSKLSYSKKITKP